MKKLLFTLALFALVATSRAVDITYIQTNDYIGNSRDTINDNFSNMLASVHASASNSVVVTFTQMSSNWYYWVSNSVDGGISYWLGCNTNGSGGADGNTPQGPWTNDVAGAGFALTGADYVQATNQAFFVVGTNILAMQGWPDATNVALNGQSLINPGGGSTDWKTRGITNSHEGWLVYQQEVATNALSQNTWTKYLIAGCAASNTIYDTGTNYGFAAGFLDETNHTFQAPVGWFSLYGRLHDGINPVTAGARDLQLYANGQPMTNINQSIYTADPAPGWPAIAGRTVAGTLYSEGGHGNFADMWQFSYAHYNASRTNIYSVYIRVGANAGLNAYTFMFRMVYEGDPR